MAFDFSDRIFAENNLESLNELVNILLNEIEIYSNCFFYENTFKKATEIVSARNVLGAAYFDKLSTPKLSEINRQYISEKLLKSFLNEWKEIGKMMEEGSIEGFYFINFLA